MNAIRLALGQMLVEGGRREANLRRAGEMIGEADRNDCRIIVLPECLDLGWTHPSARTLAEPIPGPTSGALCQAAADHGVYVVAGITERAADRIYNSAVLVDPEGAIRAVHRKINLLDIEQDLYAIGDRLAVSDTPLGKIGVNICADNFPDSLALGHALARMGAQMLLSPCAWAVPGDHDPVREPYGDLWKRAYVPLARLYEMPVVGVSNVGRVAAGPWEGRKCIGCSMAVSGDGEILVQGSYGDSAAELIAISIHPSPRQARGTSIAAMLREKGYDGP